MLNSATAPKAQSEGEEGLTNGWSPRCKLRGSLSTFASMMLNVSFTMLLYACLIQTPP